MVLSPAVHTIGCYLFSFSLHRSTGLILFFSVNHYCRWPYGVVGDAKRRPSAAANPQGVLAPLSRIVEVARRTIA